MQGEVSMQVEAKVFHVLRRAAQRVQHAHLALEATGLFALCDAIGEGDMIKLNGEEGTRSRSRSPHRLVLGKPMWV